MKGYLNKGIAILYKKNRILRIIIKNSKKSFFVEVELSSGNLSGVELNRFKTIKSI
jgi:hypothetical protein